MVNKTPNERAMSLWGHIDELRQRITRSAFAWIIGMAIVMAFVDPIVAWLVKPLGEDASVIVLSPTEAPIMYFKISLVLGFGLALPFIVRELYAFVMPGLHPEERKLFRLSIPAVLVFFVLGALFTLQVLIPISLPVLMGFLGEVVQPTYSLESYISFVTALVSWMGIIFQTPLVVFLVARFGLVSVKQLKSARRIVWFLSAVFAAVVTPTTDPVTLILVTGPFIALYEIGLIFARGASRQRERQQQVTDL